MILGYIETIKRGNIAVPKHHPIKDYGGSRSITPFLTSALDGG